MSSITSDLTQLPTVSNVALEKRSKRNLLPNNGTYELQCDTYALRGRNRKYYFNLDSTVPTPGTTKNVFTCTTKAGSNRRVALHCIRIDAPPTEHYHPCLGHPGGGKINSHAAVYAVEDVLKQFEIAATYGVGPIPLEIMRDDECLYVIEKHMRYTYKELVRQVRAVDTSKVSDVVAFLLRETLSKLVVLHGEGKEQPCVHFDIKPDNLMVGLRRTQDDGVDIEVGIIDFGVAKKGAVVPNSFGSTRMIRPRSSEEDTNDGKCTPSFDIFSTGATFLMLASNQNPFAKMDWPNFESWYQANVDRSANVSNVPETKLRNVNHADFNQAFESISNSSLKSLIKQMIHPEPAKRPPAREALRRFEPSLFRFWESPLMQQTLENEVRAFLGKVLEKFQNQASFDLLQADLRTIQECEPNFLRTVHLIEDADPEGDNNV